MLEVVHQRREQERKLVQAVKLCDSPKVSLCEEHVSALHYISAMNVVMVRVALVVAVPDLANELNEVLMTNDVKAMVASEQMS